MRVLTGLDIVEENPSLLKSIADGKIGYLCNRASVTAKLRSGISVMRDIFGNRLTCLLSPQHGLFCTKQANMKESIDEIYKPYDIPIFSLYSKVREPTDEMLSLFDTLIVDLQDVGVRVYTYIHTLALCMEACSRVGKNIIILDRPNPLGGLSVEGTILDVQYRSFVGLHPIIMRHGMTIGELAVMLSDMIGLKAKPFVVHMEGWRREMLFPDTKLYWIPPSPNLPTFYSALIYSGTVLFEGTNVSEGRGTTKPFEYIGHPSVDEYSLVKSIKKVIDGYIEGVVIRENRFIPMFDKCAGEECCGIDICIIDCNALKPWLLGVLLVKEFSKHLGQKFKWLEPPYEYCYDRIPFDIITGGSLIREWIENDGDVNEVRKLERNDAERFMKERKAYLLY